MERHPRRTGLNIVRVPMRLYVSMMIRFFVLTTLLVGLVDSGVAQVTSDLRSAAARQETDEKVRRLQAELEDTKAQVSVLNNKLEGMSRQVKAQNDALRSLADSLRSSQTGNARQSEMDGLTKSVREIEKNRKADQDQVVRGFRDLRKLILEMSSVSRPASTPRPTAQRSTPPASPKGTFHTVEKGQTLTAIMAAYITALKSDGSKYVLTQQKLKKANPRLNIDRLMVGQKIFIPLED